MTIGKKIFNFKPEFGNLHHKYMSELYGKLQIARENFKLRPNSKALQQEIEQTEERLLKLLQEHGK